MSNSSKVLPASWTDDEFKVAGMHLARIFKCCWMIEQGVWVVK
jgi:hypothetical protein